MSTRERKKFEITTGTTSTADISAALATGTKTLVAERTANQAALGLDAVPAPYLDQDDTAPLTEAQRDQLAACENGIGALRTAFWVAGKALQTVRDARLYRGTHLRFEDYLAERWEMSRPQAYRLIEAWSLGERLAVSPMGDTSTAAVSERQVRALLPISRRHGEDTAVDLYRATLSALDGRKLTAAALDTVIGPLVRTEKLPEDWRDQLNDILHQPATAEAPPADPMAPLQQTLKALRRAHLEMSPSNVTAAYAHDQAATDLLLKDIRKEVARVARSAASRTREAASQDAADNVE